MSSLGAQWIKVVSILSPPQRGRVMECSVSLVALISTLCFIASASSSSGAWLMVSLVLDR